MRRTTILIIASATTLLLTACGGGGDADPSASAPPDTGDSADVDDTSDNSETSETPPASDTSETSETSETVADSEPDAAPSDEEAPGVEIADEPYTIDLPDEVVVQVAAGERADVTAESTPTGDGVSITLSPAGAEFESPVVIRVPVEAPSPSEGVASAELVSAMLTDDDGSTEDLEVVFVDGGVDISVPHFSTVDISQENWQIQAASMLGLLGVFLADDGEEVDDVDEPVLDEPSTEGDGSGDGTEPSTDAAADGPPAGNLVLVGDERIVDLAAVLASREIDDPFLLDRDNQLGGWASVTTTGPISVTDPRLGIVRCDDPGEATVTASTGTIVGAVRVSASLTCVERGITSSEVEMVQVHDDSIPAETLAQGALSAIRTALLDPSLADRVGDTVLILDTNGNGVLDEADLLPFPAGTSLDDGIWHAIDQGGQYFLGYTTAGTTFPEALVARPLGAVEIDGTGRLIVDGQATELRVVLSRDGAGAAFWDVDFGIDLMQPSG